MKKVFRETIIATLLVLAVFGAAASAAAKKSGVQDNLNKVVDAYVAVHALLAADKTDGVAAAAAKLVSATDAAIKSTGDNGIKDALGKVKTAAAGLNTKGLAIDAARDKFGPLSDAVIALVGGYFPAALQGKYSVFHCPMAKKDWLQKDKAVKNPYYGKSMLTCGEKTALKKNCQCKDKANCNCKDKANCNCKDKKNCKCKDKMKGGHGEKHGMSGMHESHGGMSTMSTPADNALEPVSGGPKCADYQ